MHDQKNMGVRNQETRSEFVLSLFDYVTTPVASLASPQ